MRNSASQSTCREYLEVMGEEIHRIRKLQGISIEKLSDLTGLHPNTIAGAEHGKTDISLVTNARIMAALGCTRFRVGECAFSFEIRELNDFTALRKVLDLPASLIVHMTGKTITGGRKKGSLSLEELSDLSGIHRNTLWNIEKGLVNPSLFHLYKIHRSLSFRWMEATHEGLQVL